MTFFILLVKCARGSRGSSSCCIRRSDSGYKNPNRNLQIQLNTDGPIKYVEVLGGDMMSQSQSFGSYLSPMSEFSDFTLVKPSSTTDFTDTLNVLDASLPDSTWKFESQQAIRLWKGICSPPFGRLGYETITPPEIVLKSLPSPVREDAPVGTVVALISAKDLDTGENGKVSLSLLPGAPFTLKPSISNHYTLITDRKLDRESHSIYTVVIVAADSGSPQLTSRQEILVSVLDVNDNPPVFTQPFYTVYVKENSAAGSILCSVSASDPDQGENSKVSYSVVDSRVLDTPVSSYIYINSENGSIFSMHSFDYERMKVFQIQVQARDHGSPSLSNNATVHVFILDQNDNAPAVIYPSPVMGSVSHQRMPRSAKAGHLVTKVTAVDADSGHNAWISYRLAEATDASLFSVNLHTGEVRTKRSVSEQDDSSQRLLIEIKDNGEPVQSSTVTVDVLIEDGFHEPISDYRKKSSEISKKSGTMTLYLIISLASVSLLCVMTFFILLVKCARGSRGSSSCCIRRSDSGYKNPNRNLQIQLNTDGPIKYVEVLGGDMMSQSQSFGSYLSPMSEFSDFTLVKPSSTTDFTDTLNVLDASLPDSTWKFESQQIRYTIPEELSEGTVVGNIAKDLDLKLSEVFERNLRIASESGKQYFSVDPAKGELGVKERIDREALCGQSATCLLPLEAIVENPLQLYRVEIEIQDINDNSPVFQNNEKVLNVYESIAPGARFRLEAAQDPDVGANSLRTYTLSKNDHFVLDIKTEKDGSKIPQLVLETSLDREKQPTLTLLLTALDGGKPARTGTAEITVRVLDINDNAPVFEKAQYDAQIAENTQTGAVIVSVRAVDRDEGANSEIRYSFAPHTTEVIQHLFSIDAVTGDIRVKTDIDYEAGNSFKFDIVATDEGIPPMEGICNVNIEILDMNDNPPEIVLKSLPSPVREDAPVGTVVALISAKDLDTGENGKVSLSLLPGVPFTLKPSISNHYTLITDRKLDRESHSAYTVIIVAADSGSPQLTSRQEILVSVLDVNDNPPVFTQPFYTVYVKENSAAGSILCSVSASDPDQGENSKVSYSVVDSRVLDTPVSSYIYINSENGSIFSMHSFDYERMKVFQIQVQAKDHGSPSLSSNATVHVFILDQNDNAPAVIYPSPVMGSVSHQRMPRSAKAGHLVTKVTAVDADSGHNAWISYRLAEATDASLFSVNLHTGEVRTKRSVSEQDDSSQRLLIEIKDNGEPVQSSTVTVDVLIEDGFHEPISDYRKKSSEISKKSGTMTLYLIISLASVSLLCLMTFFILLVKCARGSRGSSSCCIRRSDSGYKNPNRNLQIQLNTDGPIKYVEVLGGDMMSQSQSFGSYLSPMSEFSDFTLVKPSSTTDFTDTLNVLDASLPDSTWKFESQQIRYTIPEELSEGTVVGNIAKDLDLKLSEVFQRNLRIASESGKQYFGVDPSKGELGVKERIDREALCGQSATCLLPLEAIVENPLQLYRVEIEIQDINDNSPVFQNKENTLNIAESIAPGARFRLEAAQDSDVGANSLRTYTLSKNDHFVLDVKTESDGTKVPELILETSLDREKQPTLTLLLTALDGGKPARTGTAEITVRVLDTNDNAPVFEKAQYDAQIVENIQSGTVIVSVRAVDRDEGANSEIRYSFGPHTTDAIYSLFSIDSMTGDIKVNSNIDYEASNSFKFDIIARDKGTPPMDGICRVRVDVLDVNDNPPEIVLKSLPSPVREDAPVGTVVALISAKDLDTGENGKVSLSLLPGVPFTLKPSISNHYTLITDRKLDRESHSAYTVVIVAADSGSPQLTSRQEILVSVLDVNDNPPVFTQPFYTVYVKENSAAGSILCSVSASDPDQGENSKVSYSVVDSRVLDTPVSSYIYINSENGSIFSMHSFDYERMKVFQIQVQARDHGSPSLSSNATVHVFILDQNDNAPAVIYPSPVMGSVSHQRMPRSAKAGHLVTKVTAVDADSGHNAWISYRLAEATDASLFSVNLHTGEVRTKRSVSEQDDSSQRLLIEIKDNGEPVQSSTVTVDVLIEDGFHEPISDYRKKSSEISKKSGTMTLYLIISLASVSLLCVMTFFILLVKCARGSRGSSSCCIRRSDSGYKNPNRNLQIQLNTDGPIKYVEVLGGDMMSQSQSFGSYLSPVSEFSDFTLVKPSSTTDFTDTLNVLDASLPDSTWKFESQQSLSQSSERQDRLRNEGLPLSQRVGIVIMD
ncbi:hypothetical protein NFI96_023144 [Prochilodus magdalenae]|nr:hypothetical protein NFI96_023144 [Prochilodus magdalenae]